MVIEWLRLLNCRAVNHASHTAMYNATVAFFTRTHILRSYQVIMEDHCETVREYDSLVRGHVQDALL